MAEGTTACALTWLCRFLKMLEVLVRVRLRVRVRVRVSLTLTLTLTLPLTLTLTLPLPLTLTLTLTLTEVLVAELLRDAAAEVCECILAGYNASLAPHHPWVPRRLRGRVRGS